MLEEKHYRTLDRVLQFVAPFTDQSTEHTQTAPLTKDHKRHSEIVCDVTGGEGQQTWTEYTLTMLDK